MRTRHSPTDTPFLTIRRLVLLWAGSLFLAWLAPVVGWLLADRQLKDLGHRVVTDVQAMDAARELERAILAH